MRWLMWLGGTAIALFASVVLVSLAVAQQDPTLGEIQGVWNNDNTGENIEIRGNTVQDSRRGQGRVGSTLEYAANYVIVYRGNIHCWYYMTLTQGGERLNVAVRKRDQDDYVCLSGPFSRAD